VTTSDEEVMRRARESIAAEDARPRQEFVAAVIVVVGLAIVVGLLWLYAR